jgi:addiction module HigA family antidote
MDLHVPVSRIGDIIHQGRGITSDTALWLATLRPRRKYWLNLQMKYDIEVTQRQAQKKIQREVRPRLRAAG